MYIPSCFQRTQWQWLQCTFNTGSIAGVKSKLSSLLWIEDCFKCPWLSSKFVASKPTGLTSMMLWGLTTDSTQIYKLMQTLKNSQAHRCNLLFLFWGCFFLFSFFCLFNVQWMKWWPVCLHVWAQNLMGTSWNFDVIDKRSCSPNPNGTIPYDPLCTDLLRIKETEFRPRQWEMY